MIEINPLSHRSLTVQPLTASSLAELLPSPNSLLCSLLTPLQANSLLAVPHQGLSPLRAFALAVPSIPEIRVTHSLMSLESCLNYYHYNVALSRKMFLTLFNTVPVTQYYLPSFPSLFFSIALINI